MTIYNHCKNVGEENINKEFRLKNIDETRNYLIEETNRNKFMSKKHEKISTTLNYIKHFLILASTSAGFYHIVIEKIQKVKIQNLQEKNGRILLLLKRAVCEKASGVLSSLATKKHLNKIPLVGPLLF